MLIALAFVPIGYVECYFACVKSKVPKSMKKYVKYFKATYVNRTPARGRRRAVGQKYQPRYRLKQIRRN